MKKVLSYGAGLDSFAMLLDAIERGEKPDIVVFLDVADASPTRENVDPGEWSGTYRHLREVVIPLCAEHGIEFVWLTTEDYPVRDARSLFEWLEARKQIPVSGPNRICTTIAKVERFERWAHDRFRGGVFGCMPRIEVWIGFEAGEEGRAEKDPNAGKASGWRQNRFPLQERGLCRCRCEALVRRLGYPIPRKSACVFCPYGTKADWKTFERELPDQFARTVALEANKPPTSNGAKLSIRNFRTKKLPDGTKKYLPTFLPDYVKQPERKKPPKICTTCGEVRATKATGCGWLDEAA